MTDHYLILLANSYIKQLEHAFANAEAGKSNVPKEILTMGGMTGKKTRHFYNNLLQMEDSRYLEIGTWMGSSVCSAMCYNRAKVVCIDNWSEFNAGNIRDIFFSYFTACTGDNDARFIESDCFSVDTAALGKFNIYLYDGGHDYEDHFKALAYYLGNMDDLFIYIVDDWNWARVRNGTNDYIAQAGLNILWKKEIILTENDEHTPARSAKANWWNGIAVFLLQKPAIRQSS